MERGELGSERLVGGFGAGPGTEAAGMDHEGPGAAPLSYTLEPSSEPGFGPLPFFLRDSPTSWDLCTPLPATKNQGAWESSLLWVTGPLVVTSSSPGQPGGAGSVSPQPPLGLSGFPLAKPWDSPSPDDPADATPNFVHPPVTAAHPDPDVPWLMSRINPAGSTPSPPPLDPAGFPSPELWTGPDMDAPPEAAPDPALRPVAAACLDPTDVPPTAKTTPAGSTPSPPPLDPAGFPSPELWTGPDMDVPSEAAPDPVLRPVAAACLDPTDVPPTAKTTPDLGEVMAHVSHTLSCHPKGMRVKPLMKRLLKEHGVDLLAFSPDEGYRGVVSFLQQVPGIELWNPEKGEKCRVLSCTFKKNVADPLPLLCSTLDSFPNGLRVFSLRKAMWQRHGVNLEEFSQQQGYLNTLDYLTRLPGIRLQGLERGEKCLVQRQKGAAVKPPAPQPPPDPAPPTAQHSRTPPPDAPADGGPTGAPGEALGLAEVSAWVRDVLGRFPLGLKLAKLKEALRVACGLDLEALSRQRGCGDALHLLRALPHLWLGDPGKGDACLVRLGAGASVKPPAPQHPPDPTPPSAQHSRTPPPDAPADVGPPGAPGEALGLAEVSAWVRDVLGRFPLGLKLAKLKEALRVARGLDLEALSRQRGYGDALHLLRALPHLWLGDPGMGDACLVRLGADAASNAPAEAGGAGATGPARGTRGQGRVAKPGVMEAFIRGALAPFPFGMRVKRLKRLLVEKHGAKLEAFSQARGYGDVVSFLRDVPGLMVQDPEKGNKCIVKLQRGVPADATKVLPLLKRLVRSYRSGLQLQKVQELLLERHGLDLKGYVDSQGEADVLGFLQHRLPTLQCRQPEKGEKCVVWLRTGQAKGSGSLPPGSAYPLPGSKRCLFPANAAERPAPPATDCLNPRLPSATTNRPLLPSLPSGRESFPAVLGKLGKSPRANPRLPAWLLTPPRPTGGCSGLRAEERTQESGARPANAPLALQTEERTQESGVRPASAPLALRTEERTQESGPRPASAPLALRAEEGTQESGPRPASAPLALRAEEGTQESGPRPASAPLALRAEEKTQESGARSASAPLALRAEEGTQESGAQPPEDLRELKRKVGAILAGHPGGMSLFQFRAAYSAAHQHPLPLGRSASTKQRLAQMPDVVRMQGCGVQMLLLPVEPDSPPGGEPGLALWIPQEAAALAGDPDDAPAPRPAPAVPDPVGDPHVPAEPCSTLSEIPPAPALTGESPTPAETPPVPPASTLTGDPQAPAETPTLPPAPALTGEPPTSAETPPLPPAPALTGEPPTSAETPPLPPAPTLTGEPPTSAETPPLPPASDLTGDPQILAEPAPLPPAPDLTRYPHTSAEPPPLPPAPDLTGDPQTLAEPPPLPPAPDLTGDPQTLAEPAPLHPALDLTGDPQTPAEILPFPPAPNLTGDPQTPAETPPFPPAPDLTGDPPTLAEIPPVLPAPAPDGAPEVPVKPPPAVVAPRWGPNPQAVRHPEAARPEASWELPTLVPSAPVVLPAAGQGSSSWGRLGAEPPPGPGDPAAAARPVVYPPPREVPPAPSAGPGPPQAQIKRVQLVPPFQDAPRAQPAPKALGQNPGMSAAVGSPVGPIPADPAAGQADSPAKELPGVAPNPLPPPAAGVLVTPNRGRPEAGCRSSGGKMGSSVDPLLCTRPAQPVPSAGRTQPGLWAGIPAPARVPSPPRHTDSCLIL